MFLKKKKFAKGLDRMVLTGSCGPTSVLTVHGINKKSGSLGLKNQFSSRFPVFTVRPPGPVRFWKPCSREEEGSREKLRNLRIMANFVHPMHLQWRRLMMVYNNLFPSFLIIYFYVFTFNLLFYYIFALKVWTGF